MTFKLFATVAIVGTVLTASVGMANAGFKSGSLDWLKNDDYVRCLKYVSALSKGNAAAYDRGRRTCNRTHYPNRPGTDY